ncbi:hypothetical protein [Streptococcus hyovaginalis]|nr:hypothetical protein [Streptococcus hyovaginalis]MDY5973941.1 hypothetical protein [Streptococcus hyovaginalis]
MKEAFLLVMQTSPKTKHLYAQYSTEKGESQQVTKDKNQAFTDLEK